MYEDILSNANCSDVADHLDCLRVLSYEDYKTASAGQVFFPTVDGDFVPTIGSVSKKNRKFYQVPIITGTTTDDSSEFGPTDRNTSYQVTLPPLVENTGYTISNSSWTKILKLYPDDPTQGIPANTGSERFAQFGYQYKRISVIGGDVLFHGPRRQDARVYTEAGLDVYSYRFDILPFVNGTNSTWTDTVGTPQAAYYGVSHGAELPFVLCNPSHGLGNLLGPLPSYAVLAKQMSSMWISFVYSLNPNLHGIDGVAMWPTYGWNAAAQNITCGSGCNFVFNATIEGGGFVEEDTWRAEGMDFLIDTMAERVQ